MGQFLAASDTFDGAFAQIRPDCDLDTINGDSFSFDISVVLSSSR